MALPRLACSPVARRRSLPYSQRLAAPGGGDDAVVVAEPVAEVEPDGDSVGAGQGCNQCQSSVPGHRAACGPLPRLREGPDERGGTADIRRTLQELLAQRSVVKLILRVCLVVAGADERDSGHPALPVVRGCG